MKLTNAKEQTILTIPRLEKTRFLIQKGIGKERPRNKLMDLVDHRHGLSAFQSSYCTVRSEMISDRATFRVAQLTALVHRLFSDIRYCLHVWYLERNAHSSCVTNKFA